jgi:hypothetical protein
MPESKAGSTFHTSKTRRGRSSPEFWSATRDPTNASAGKRLMPWPRDGSDRLPTDDFSRIGNRDQFHRSANRILFDHAEFRVRIEYDRSEMSAKRKTGILKKFDRAWNEDRFQPSTAVKRRFANRSDM